MGATTIKRSALDSEFIYVATNKVIVRRGNLLMPRQLWIIPRTIPNGP